MTSGSLGHVRDEEEQLANRRWHWDTAYEISRSGDTWTARFLDGTEKLAAGSSCDLREMIRADYLARTSAAGSDSRPAGRRREVGAGERALRRLRDDGVI